MMLLALLALILFPSVASATSDAPDLLRIDVNFTWSGIPFLPGPVTVSGSNVYQHGIGYIDTQGVLTRPNYVVADTGVSSRSYVDIGWSPTHLGINLEAGIPGGVGPDGARFPSGYQHFTAGVSETPGTYTGASFQNESGPLSTYGIFAADRGSVRVVGVPEARNPPATHSASRRAPAQCPCQSDAPAPDGLGRRRTARHEEPRSLHRAPDGHP